MDNPKKLTLFEAAAIVSGYGIGGGIMAVPYLTSINGMGPFVLILVAAFLVSVLFHLMLAEIGMRDSTSSQIIESFDRYLFKGPARVFLTWFFFILTVAAFFTNLAAYIAGGGEILRQLLGIPLWMGQIVIYLIAAGVVFFGLKTVGLSEKYAVAGILVLVVVLSIASLSHPFHFDFIKDIGYQKPLALFGMVMFSFQAIFSVPQATQGLSWNKKLIPKAVVLGVSINLFTIVVVTISSVGVSQEVTRIAITGWGKELGSWAFIVGNLFVLLAMLTSYWAISFALSTIIKERLDWGDKTCWIVATLPTLLIVITGITDFLGFMRLTGGVVALLIAILVVPTYRKVKKNGDVKNPEWHLGSYGNSFFQIIVVISFLLMAVGSMVQIN